MKKYLKLAALVAVLAIVAVACGGGSTEPSATGSTPGGDVPRGGTLHAALVDDVIYGFDPTREYYSVSWEILRSGFTRTLQSYTGEPGAAGAELYPDLAASDPVISEDGLTWTWTLRDGIMFGSPLSRPIVAQDFVTAVNRIADPEGSEGGYPFYYSTIVGFDEAYDSKTVDEVTGAVAVDDKTFQISLEEPTGDLAYMMAMPAGAPIPEEAVSAHYKDYGQFLVSSGPYEFEGMADIDVTDPKAKPPTGMDLGKSYILVRNPNWTQEIDPLRPAYTDRIEIAVGGDTQSLLDKVDAGDLDICIDCGATSTTLSSYQNDPTKFNAAQSTDPGQCNPAPCRLQVFGSDVLSYSALNVFEPPFDDVYVRRAVNFVMDKAALQRVIGGPIQGEIANHFVPDSLLGGALTNADYNPFPSTDSRGDVEAAKAEIAQSAYGDADGMCTDPACKDVLTLSVADDPDVVKGIEVWTTSFAKIGITLDVKYLDIGTMYTRCGAMATHAAFCPNVGWGKDYPSPYTFFLFPVAGGEGCCNYSFLGTNADALTENGYAVPAEIPSIDEDMAACRAIPPGDEANACWAELDKRVTEEIVSQVPRRFATNLDVIGPNVVNYSFDQFAGQGALDQYAVASAA
jgi:peptide/nickel transport system substrate-binding protein